MVWQNFAPEIPRLPTLELILVGIMPLVLTLCGTICNLLCIIVLLSKLRREASRNSHRVSTNVYLICLCFADTIALYQFNLDNSVANLTGKSIMSRSLITCKLLEFFGYYTLHLPVAYLTMATIDRTFMLWSPAYKRKIAHPKQAWRICISIAGTLLLTDCFLLALGYVDADGTIQCFHSTNAALYKAFLLYLTWFHLVLMTMVPFAVMLLCTLLTIIKLVRLPRVNEASYLRNRRISIMLACMCITYILLTLPNRLCFSVLTPLVESSIAANVIFSLTDSLTYLASSLNYLFLSVTVKGFWTDLRSLLTMRRFHSHTTETTASTYF
ncbi:unnamed protein product [Didymodactylos carnosus]|uniref:G-protein coupled receptors family 1 profile domain-containing protein n=1 Tax=Didymodactylos carnosus TaxID=1234261 RepID=A0A814YLS5_9BILA|nr:unnamed protein product [Didymodactylos carnosus]CAF1231717.1 unnamed protein product [Didymodactylos carnosus]CAF3834381.1 unnamed protein product [Didymodactylos carnosus]CAF3994395.1 unnamed protein product [Didymodactylos carnosus]